MIYLPSIEIQTRYFLYSILLGIIIAILYDFLRLFRKIIYKNLKPKLYISDILIFIFAAFLIVIFTVIFGFGVIRIYSILGAFLGFVIYINSIGLITFKVEDFLVQIFYKLVSFFVVKPTLFLLKVLKKIKYILYNILNYGKTGDF